MTIDEAIKNREGCLKYLEGIGPKASPECLEAVRWSVKALKALRPVSREAWTAEWTVDEVGHKCSKCGEYLPDGEDVRKPQFCPECGRAMTDEAVEMVIRRWEELYNA